MESGTGEDAIILTCECMDKTEVKVTLNVLEKVSQYFERLGASGFKEMQEKRIHLMMFSADDVQTLVDFAEGSLKITEFQKDIEKLLHLADYFGMDSLQEFCRSAIEETVRKVYKTNAVVLEWVYNISVQYQLKIEKFVTSLCADNIQTIHLDADFSALGVEFIDKVFTNSNLHVKDEKETLIILLKWCGKNIQKLQQNPKLYKSLHIPSVTDKQLHDISELLYKYNLHNFAEYVKMKHRFYKDNYAVFFKTFPEYNFMRNSGRTIFLVGGLHARKNVLPSISEKCLLQVIETTKDVMIINFDYSSKWSLAFNLCEFALCVLDNFVYVAGGQRRYVSSGNMARSGLFVLNPHTGQWKKLASMREKRCLFYLGVLEGGLVAVGGCNQIGVISSVECYSLQNQTWTDGPTLPCPLHEHAGCIHDGKLYVSGGHDRSNLTNRMLCLKNTKERWKECQPMRIPRSYHVMAVIGTDILVMGGAMRTQAGEFCDCYDCELYNPATDQWTVMEIPTMPQDFYVSCCMPLQLDNHYIVCLGGYSFTKKAYKDTGVMYDTVRKKWTKLHLNNVTQGLLQTMCVFASTEVRTTIE